ncbi:MAG: 2-keto-4-pentenoate hydratase [Pirellulales bacterium]|jgi:2-keto-4-pentenoate hydratase
MNSSELVSSQIDQWAVRQLGDYDAHNPGTIFDEEIVLNVEQGYQLQAAVTQLRCDRGENVIGYKVGCTSPAIRAQLGIDHCVTGRLFDTEKHTSGTTLSRSQFANLAIEGELAVELLHEPTEDGFREEGLPECAARVFPVIELHHHVLRGENPSPGELIANNAIHAGFVLGKGMDREEISGNHRLSIYSDNSLLEQCEGLALIQTIHSSLKWLMEVVKDRGEHLEAGQIILTGSIPSLIPIKTNCCIKVDAGPLGQVEAQFIQ